MRLSQLLYKGFREDPEGAEAASHRFLLRASYIHRTSAGVYSYLPLGYRVLRKISDVVRGCFSEAGAQEILMPVLTPIELWRQSGRAKLFGDKLPAYLTEGRGGLFVLGPTHEEVVTSLVGSLAQSFRDLPKLVFQIQQKFRDEARPRFGLVRTRELIMADAYSFDTDKEAMGESYKRMYDAYFRLFARLGLEVEAVEAAAGAIGGDVNHEFMVRCPIGEDSFVSCSSCGLAANVEALTAQGSTAFFLPEALPELSRHHTPGLTRVKEVAEALSREGLAVSAEHVVKSLAARDAEGRPVLALVRGDREMTLPPGWRLFADQDFAEYSLPKGYVGPVDPPAGIRVVADLALLRVPETGFVIGAGEEGYHLAGAVPSRDFRVDEVSVLSTPETGDPCPRCGGTIAVERAIEVGHTFQLGITYSSKIKGAEFAGPDGRRKPYFMGCYGVGVSRLLATIAEAYADEKGLFFPEQVAPYSVHVVPLSADALQAAEAVYEAVARAGVEVLLDDRGVSAGEALNDADLIGIPWRIVVGPKGLRKGLVEVRPRSHEGLTRSRAIRGLPGEIKELYEVPLEDVVAALREVLLA